MAYGSKMIERLRLPADEELFKEIPTQEETREYQQRLYMRIQMEKMLGPRQRDGKDAVQKEPDNLAEAYEQALKSFLSWNNYTSDIKSTQHELLVKLGKTMREYLENTGGHIGAFPYAGERVVACYVDENDGSDKRDVRLEKFSAAWETARIGDLEKYLEKWDEQPLTNPHTPHVQRYGIIFAVSALLDLLFLLLAAKAPGLFLLTMPTGIIAAISLFRLFISFKDMIAWQKRAGENGTYDHYNGRIFRNGALELHRMVRFFALWADRLGDQVPEFYADAQRRLPRAVERYNAYVDKCNRLMLRYGK